MSVFAYVGLPRSGKTYTAVSQQILPALRQGRLVVTNVPMKRDVVVRDIPDAENLLREFPMAAVVAAPDSIWEHCPNGALVVLDEVWRFWPAGKKVDKIPEAWKSFLAEHGHRVDAAGNAMQVVLITQDLAQIAAFARQLVEQTFRTIKLSSIGFHKKFRTDIYGGPVQGPNPPEAQRLRQIFGTYDPKVYQYYTSHTLSEAGEGGANEKAIDERGNVFLKPAMMALPFLVLGLVWFGWHFLSKSHSQLVGAPASAARGAAVGGVSAAASGAPVAALAQRAGGWYVSGVLEGGVGKFADTAMVSDGERNVFVDLRRCRRYRFAIECPTETGEYASSRAPHSRAPSAPPGARPPVPLAKPSGPSSGPG